MWSQSFILCGSDNPSEWMGFITGIGFKKQVRRDGLYWVPIAPAIPYNANGEIDETLTEKAAYEFSEAYKQNSDLCKIRILPSKT